MKERVCLNGCPEYDLDELCNILDGQFRALGVYEELKPGMTALLKPNLILRSKPEAAAVTHPLVTAAVGLCVQKAGAKVLIAESGGGPYTPGVARGTFAACGYEEMAKRFGFSLYTQCKSREVELPQGVRCRQLPVIEPFLEDCYLINIAKLKTHCMMGFSGAVKNLFGAVPGLQKPELHCRFPQKEDFADMLLDLSQFLSPALSVIDGVWAMEGDGPTGGERRQVGALLSSKSPWALDVIGAAVLGMDRKELLLLQKASERGLGPGSPEEVELLGDPIEALAVSDFRRARSQSTDFLMRVPKLFRPLAKKLTTPYPKIEREKCVGCGKCAQSCPQHTIKIAENRAKIDYQHCIRCFCCHEMCPQRAVKIHRFSLFRF